MTPMPTPTSRRSLFDRLADMDERSLAVCLLAPAFVFISLIVVYPVATLYGTVSTTCAD